MSYKIVAALKKSSGKTLPTSCFCKDTTQRVIIELLFRIFPLVICFKHGKRRVSNDEKNRQLSQTRVLRMLAQEQLNHATEH